MIKSFERVIRIGTNADAEKPPQEGSVPINPKGVEYIGARDLVVAEVAEERSLPEDAREKGSPFPQDAW